MSPGAIATYKFVHDVDVDDGNQQPDYLPFEGAGNPFCIQIRPHHSQSRRKVRDRCRLQWDVPGVRDGGEQQQLHEESYGQFR